MRFLLIFSLLLAGGTTVSLAQSKETRATVYVETAYIRETASMSATVVGSLTKGTAVVVLERREDWTKISADKAVGWVRASTLTISGDASPEPTRQAPTVPEPPRRDPVREPAREITPEPPSAADSPAQPPIGFGLIAAASSSTMAGPSLDVLLGFAGGGKTKRLLGAHLGAFISWRVASSLSLELQPSAARKGFDVEFPDFDVSTGTHFWYVELPVLARIDLAPAQAQMKPFVYGGPAVAFNVMCDVVTKVPDEPVDKTACDADGAEGPNKLDVGLLLGGGIEFSKLSIFLQYNHGLMNVPSSSSDEILKHRVISGGLRIRIR